MNDLEMYFRNDSANKHTKKGAIEKAGITELSVSYFILIFKIHGFLKIMHLNLNQ
jgi:hypothetical protein